MARMNDDSKHQALLEDDEENEHKDMDLCSIHIKSADNVDGKPGFIVTCSYRMDPDKVEDDTPWAKRRQSEDYIATTKAKAAEYVMEQMDELNGDDDDASPSME